eukprot:1708716-Pyramimonas_sp.AAC.1
MEKGGVDEASLWVKGCEILPMYSGDQKKKMRLLLHIEGTILVHVSKEAEEEHQKKTEEAIQKGEFG